MTGRPSYDDGATPEADAASLPRISDLYRWAREQAAHIRAGRFDQADIENIAEEIETVGRSEYDALVSNLSIVLTHMLEWDHQTSHQSRSWALSIDIHRDHVAERLDDSPSLKTRRDEAVTRAYRRARKEAARETGLEVASFPAACPYDWTAIMERPFNHEV